MPFNQQMAFPCRLTLRKTADGVRMFAEPVKEIETLHTKKHTVADQMLKPGDNPLGRRERRPVRHSRRVRAGATRRRSASTCAGVPVVYDVKKQEISCKDVKAPLKRVDGKVRLRLLVDRGSIEIFGNDGQVALSVAAHPRRRQSRAGSFQPRRRDAACGRWRRLS